MDAGAGADAGGGTGAGLRVRGSWIVTFSMTASADSEARSANGKHRVPKLCGSTRCQTDLQKHGVPNRFAGGKDMCTKLTTPAIAGGLGEKETGEPCCDRLCWNTVRLFIKQYRCRFASSGAAAMTLRAACSRIKHKITDTSGGAPNLLTIRRSLASACRAFPIYAATAVFGEIEGWRWVEPNPQPPCCPPCETNCLVPHSDVLFPSLLPVLPLPRKGDGLGLWCYEAHRIARRPFSPSCCALFERLDHLINVRSLYQPGHVINEADASAALHLVLNHLVDVGDANGKGPAK